MIEKLKKDDSIYYPYKDENGVSYESNTQYIQIEVLGFCGCGNPDSAMKYVRDALLLVSKKYEIGYSEWKLRVDKLFPILGSEYFMWYFLDNKGFTEHGGSVPGWITDKGEELLRDIAWCLENEKEED